MLVHCRVTPSVKFTSTYLWVERGTVKAKNLAQEYNIMPWPGLELRPLDVDTGALTMRPTRLRMSEWQARIQTALCNGR